MEGEREMWSRTNPKLVLRTLRGDPSLQKAQRRGELHSEEGRQGWLKASGKLILWDFRFWWMDNDSEKETGHLGENLKISSLAWPILLLCGKDQCRG